MRRGICGHRPSHIGQSGWDRAATSRRRVQRIPADDREVPSFQTRKVIETSPLDPAADLAGALRGLPDRGGLRVVSRPEMPQRLQKFPLIFRRTFPRHAPLRESDHPPSRSPTVAPLLSFVATRCGDQVFLWQRSMRRFFCSLVAKTSQPQLSARLLENATNELLTRTAWIRGIAAWVVKRLKPCLLSDVPAAESRWSLRAARQSRGNWMTSAMCARSAAPRRSER